MAIPIYVPFLCKTTIVELQCKNENSLLSVTLCIQGGSIR